jgi:small subunit ribosomal protein S6
MFIVDPTVSDEGLAQVQQRFVDLATSGGAEIKKIAPWERRRLAYEIRGRRDGIYILAELRAKPNTIVDLENQLQVAEVVLRHLVVRLSDD